MKPWLLTIFLLCLTSVLFAQSHSLDTSFINNKKKIRVITKELKNDFVLLTVFCNSKNILSDTLDGVRLLNLELIDFNKDKSRDIMLTYIGNNPTYFLYLFDTKTNTFKNVKGFDDFLDAKQLKSNPKYYYSYHHDGCADLNWVSDLFIIRNFTAIHKGHIYAQGCEFDVRSNPQIIEVYKIFNNDEKNKKIIVKLPLLKYVPHYGDKWNFIEKYWNKNFLKFQ